MSGGGEKIRRIMLDKEDSSQSWCNSNTRPDRVVRWKGGGFKTGGATKMSKRTVASKT